MLTEYPSANVHNKECLVHFNKTNEEGRYRRNFFILCELTEIIDTTVQQANRLDFSF